MTNNSFAFNHPKQARKHYSELSVAGIFTGLYLFFPEMLAAFTAAALLHFDSLVNAPLLDLTYFQTIYFLPNEANA